MSGTARALRHLASSPEVRALAAREWLKFVLPLFAAFMIGLGLSWLLGNPLSDDGLLSGLIGISAIILQWLVGAVRTVRGVLREHGSLD